MRAIILAAGSGLRLGQHTKDIPKALLDLNGKSILERQISLLRQHAINEIFAVTGYQREKHTLKDIEYIFNPRYAETEQLASMMVARTKISDDVLIIFGDIVFDEQILQQILVSNDDIGIAIDLDWEKSYNERPDNPKSLADKVLIYQKKIQQISDEKAEEAVKTIIQWIGKNPEREGLKSTPKRVIKAFKEYFQGYNENPENYLTKTFTEVEGYDDMVMEKNIW